jgi:hypothetical protein
MARHRWRFGTAQLPFKVNILLDETGAAQPLNIKKAVNIYVKQETGSVSDDGTLPTLAVTKMALRRA